MLALRRRLLFVAFVVVASFSVALAQAEKVYVTRTGAKYHRASCSSLSKSTIEMSLVQAAARYGACKNCNPPVPVSTPVAGATFAPANRKPVERAAPAESGRCHATTKKRTQCSRKAQAGRSYCWQHP